MSMFRSAAEISSSDSEVSSEESESSGVLRTGHENNAEEAVEERDTPLGGADHEDGERTSKEDAPGIKSPTDIDIEGHSNFLTSALLEFYCFIRATDILNAQPGSHRKYTRESPEVQYLGTRLFLFKSGFLSSHGMLSPGIDKEELRLKRQFYRDNLDRLGASALEGLKLDEPQGRSLAMGTTDDRRTTSSLQMNRPLIADKEHAQSESVGIRGLGKLFQKDKRGGSLEDIRLDMTNLHNQNQSFFGSSPAGFPLFSTPVSPTGRIVSRYSVDFSEMKALGRGSFGQVYHVVNHIDGQHYAVKKIPLSQRRLDQLQFGDENQLEAIMTEIRTLAKLEHTNVVRYYGAWVEQSHIAPVLPSQVPSDPKSEANRSNLLSHAPTESQSYGIVFEGSEGSAPDRHSSSVSEEPFFSPPGKYRETSPSKSPEKSRRRDSHATISSYHSRKSLGLTFDDSEGDIESIPREFDIPTPGEVSTFDLTNDDVFTDGLSQDHSNLQLQRKSKCGIQDAAVILHIQMSLHPISLGSYLSPQSVSAADDSESPSRRHCYHLVPSLRFMLDIISGVEYLHSKGIIHRDLKPANIFLSTPEIHDLSCPSCQSECGSKTQYCHPRIGDFGLVADISHLNDSSPKKSDSPPKNSPSLDRIVGTEFYRPSIRKSDSNYQRGLGNHEELQTVDEKLDIYALGVILFELLYRLNTKMERQLVLTDLTRGKNPHPSQKSTPGQTVFPADFAQKIHQGDIPVDDGVSVAQALMACIKGMLEINPQQRWSCSDTKRQLKKILAAISKTTEHDD
ncbi:STYKc [Aspergillus sclerotialis]|uniref:STYKc n=1 Tax=Aspergillus sclerotialis TaxID=2070753 RepID=A0A3A2ZR10_9EURO|nr:STYKc [Aspergillus sclerotialis]